MAGVVVTGMGAVSPVGIGVPVAWSALLAGTSGVGRIAGFDTSDTSVHIGGEVHGLEVPPGITAAEVKRLDEFHLLGITACFEALRDASLEGGAWADPGRVAVLAGSGYGPEVSTQRGTRMLDAKGPRAVSPYLSVYGTIDSLSADLAIRVGAMGTTHAITAACASGTVVIGEGLRLIRHGYADVVICLGVDGPLNLQDLASTANTRALTTEFADEPHRASRPFDRARSGFVMSSGAAALVLESVEHARRRDARPLARLLGYAATTDAHHMTAPHPEAGGAREAMRLALADAKRLPAEVAYVNAHGTSTPLNDARELTAIEAVLGTEHVRSVAISSTKSMTGHMLGAAGAFEAVATVCALRDRLAPPTINLDDPEFPGFNLVPHRPCELGPGVAISNSFGFGGHNASIVLAAPEEAPR